MKRFALCFLFACSSSSSSAPTAQTPSPSTVENKDPAPSDPAPTEADASTKLGEPCGDGDACAKGQHCVKYYGIAGPRGPEFKSCEIKCKDDSDCPEKHKCTTVADGPGQVCRPIQ